MKQYVIDFCFVIFLMCVISMIFGDHQVSQTLFERSIDQFEENISVDNQNQPYVTIQDTSDNQVSLFMEKVSHGCVQVIEFIALVFSNFVSMIVGVVLYY